MEWDSVKEIKIKNNRTAPVPLGRASHVRTLATPALQGGYLKKKKSADSFARLVREPHYSVARIRRRAPFPGTSCRAGGCLFVCFHVNGSWGVCSVCVCVCVFLLVYVVCGRLEQRWEVSR